MEHHQIFVPALSIASFALAEANDVERCASWVRQVPDRNTFGRNSGRKIYRKFWVLFIIFATAQASNNIKLNRTG